MSFREGLKGLRSSAGGLRPCFSRRWRGASTPHPPACPDTSAPKGMSPTCVQTPHAITTSTDAIRACCRPVLAPSESAFRGQTSPLPLPLAGWRSGDLRDPLGECRRDANSLAPNGPKARTLRCARQELVRVPESNTKYGGLRGITGGKPTPVGEPSIGESSGIPNRKNLQGVMVPALHPAVHRAGIFLPRGIASAGLT